MAKTKEKRVLEPSLGELVENRKETKQGVFFRIKPSLMARFSKLCEEEGINKIDALEIAFEMLLAKYDKSKKENH